jgi:sigma-E factor negative regulatory protein RseA
MTTESNEHLSQLMDGEIGGETGRFVLRRLEASSELRATWARYHLIRDCLRHQDRGFANDNLSARVRRALEGSTESSVAKAGTRNTVMGRWMRPAAGFAVAAAVALMAVIAVAPNLPTGSADIPQSLATAESQPFTSPNILSRSPPSRQVNLTGGNEPAAGKMNSYLLRHYQVAGSSGGNGFVAFVPIVITKSATQTPSDPQTESRERQAQESDSNSQ